MQQLALLASTLQALVTGCCCCTRCTSSSGSTRHQGAHLATQLTSALLESLLQLERQLSSPSLPTAAAVAADKDSPAAADKVDRLVHQCTQLIKQQQQKGRVSAKGAQAGGLSPRASSCTHSPRATAAVAPDSHLQQLADQAALEAERLQLQQEREQIQQQVSVRTEHQQG